MVGQKIAYQSKKDPRVGSEDERSYSGGGGAQGEANLSRSYYGRVVKDDVSMPSPEVPCESSLTRSVLLERSVFCLVILQPASRPTRWRLR